MNKISRNKKKDWNFVIIFKIQNKKANMGCCAGDGDDKNIDITKGGLVKEHFEKTYMRIIL